MLVYSYHVYRRHMTPEDLEVCEAQFALAHEFKIQCLKNQRLRLQADLDAQRTSVTDELTAQIESYKARLDALWTEAKKHPKTKRVDLVPEVMAEIASIRQTRKPLFEALYEERTRVRKTDAYKDARASRQQAHLARARELRAAWSDRVHYVTRGLAEAAAEQSFTKALTSGSRIHIDQYEGYGSIGGQVRPATNGGWDIVHFPPMTHPTRPSGKPRKIHATIALKIGAVESTKRWVDLPCAIHRPLPDAAIKEARLCRDVEDGQPVYTLRLTLDIDKPLSTSEASVGINFGWRQVDDRLRVAAWQGDDGASGILELPSAVRHKWGKAAELRSLRADRLNDFRERLKTLTDAPVHLWQSMEPVHALRKQLGDNAPPDLIEWVRRDRHLGHYETGCRRNAILLRREIYRVFASQLAKKYRYLVIEGDIRNKDKPVDLAEAQQHSAATSTNSVLASLSELRMTLAHAGLVVVTVDRRQTSRLHHGCGGTLADGSTIDLACETCGRETDRDLNAARNILGRGQDEKAKAANAHTEKQTRAAERKAARLAGRLAARKKLEEAHAE
jgi:hypothetical protein